MAKRVFGGLMILMAAALLGWVGYNKFVRTLPAAEGMSVVPPLLFCAGLIYVGQKWIRGTRRNAEE
ncbi:MAG: hypothetical protein ACYS9X_19135 [Planctomycetota bacterium]|jgi:hypothetical protein